MKPTKQDLELLRKAEAIGEDIAAKVAMLLVQGKQIAALSVIKRASMAHNMKD